MTNIARAREKCSPDCDRTRANSRQAGDSPENLAARVGKLLPAPTCIDGEVLAATECYRRAPASQQSNTGRSSRCNTSAERAADRGVVGLAAARGAAADAPALGLAVGRPNQ